MQRCEGPECVVDFEAKTARAKYCSATCRSRAARERKAAAESVEADERSGRAEHALVRAVRKELEDATAFETVDGQLALQVARRIVDPDGSGISALSKELRSLLADAKAAAGAPSTTGASPSPVVKDDEVERARRRRKEIAQAAAAAGAEA